MSLRLTNQDYEIICDLKRRGLLKDVAPHRIHAPNGFMALVCSDCDQLHDKIDFLRNVSTAAANLERVHLFALNGGGTLMSPYSETRIGNEHEILLGHARNAMKMKEMDTLILKCHAPCGAAAAAGLDFHAVLGRTFEGKRYAKKHIPDIHVVCFVQIDFGDRRPPETRKRTYAVTLHDWEDYLACVGLNNPCSSYSV